MQTALQRLLRRIPSTAKSVRKLTTPAPQRRSAPSSLTSVARVTATTKPTDNVQQLQLSRRSGEVLEKKVAKVRTQTTRYSKTAVPVYATEKDALLASFQNWKLDRAFYVKDVGVVERQYDRFLRNMPRIRPFYAVKCNPDPVLCETLAHLGAGFDCATGAELEQIVQLGVPVKDIIFANPIKNAEDLQYAASVGVTKMTFDNADELVKIKQYHPNAELVLRILPDDSGSLMRFGAKFGAALPVIRSLLQRAKDLNLKVIGVSFHIGSGCFDAASYDRAISLARNIFDMAEDVGLAPFSLLDIGGGFPGNPIPNLRADDKTPSFEEFSAVVNKALLSHFNEPKHARLQLIAEPGRYFGTAWATLFTLVQGKREQHRESPASPRKFLYYINDGVYGSFNCIMFDHATCSPIPCSRLFGEQSAVAAPADAAAPSYPSTFFGPTCDSIDVVCKDFPTEELHVGEWVAFANMGAYTTAAASRFNGVQLAATQYVRSEAAALSSSPVLERRSQCNGLVDNEEDMEEEVQVRVVRQMQMSAAEEDGSASDGESMVKRMSRFQRRAAAMSQ